MFLSGAVSVVYGALVLLVMSVAIADSAVAGPLDECKTKSRINAKYDCEQATVNGPYLYHSGVGPVVHSWEEAKNAILGWINSNGAGLLCSSPSFAWT